MSAFTGTGTTYSATFTPRTGFEGKATIDIPVGVFSDALGNSNAVAPTTVEIVIDTEVPTVVITSDESNVGGNTGTAVDTATITFTLSENSSDFTITDVTVTNGQLSSFDGTGAAYTATFTPDEDFAGTATLDIAGGAFTDEPGNDNTPAANKASPSTRSDRRLRLTHYLLKSVVLTTLPLHSLYLRIRITLYLQTMM